MARRKRRTRKAAKKPRRPGTPLRANPDMRIVKRALDVEGTVRKLGAKGRVVFKRRR